MPMVYCSRCGKLVSTRAGSCCRCGEPLEDDIRLRRYELMRVKKQNLKDIYAVCTLSVATLLMFLIFIVN